MSVASLSLSRCAELVSVSAIASASSLCLSLYARPLGCFVFHSIDKSYVAISSRLGVSGIGFVVTGEIVVSDVVLCGSGYMRHSHDTHNTSTVDA